MRIWASDYSIRYSCHCSDFSIITCIPVSLSVTWHLTVARSTQFLGRLETFSTHSLQQNLTAHLYLLSTPCGMPRQRPSPLLEEYDCNSFPFNLFVMFSLFVRFLFCFCFGFYSFFFRPLTTTHSRFTNGSLHLYSSLHLPTDTLLFSPLDPFLSLPFAFISLFALFFPAVS